MDGARFVNVSLIDDQRNKDASRNFAISLISSISRVVLKLIAHCKLHAACIITLIISRARIMSNNLCRIYPNRPVFQ